MRAETLAAIAASSLALASCTGASEDGAPDAASSDNPQASAQASTGPVTAPANDPSGAMGSTDGGTRFAQYRSTPLPDGAVSDSIGVVGTLRIANGCAWVEAVNGITTGLVFPSGTVEPVGDDALRYKETVYRAGEEFTTGGSVVESVPKGRTEGSFTVPVPESCNADSYVFIEG